MNNHAHGAFGAQLISNRDLTPHTTAMSFTPTIDVFEDTGLSPLGDSKTYLQGLNGAAASSSGYLVNDPDFIKAEMANLTGNLRGTEPLTQGWFGFGLGKFLTMSNTRKTQYNAPVSNSSTITTSINHQLQTQYYHGHALYNPFGRSAYSGNEAQALTFDNADVNQRFALRFMGHTELFAFTSDVSNATLKAGIEGLLDSIAGLESVTATVTGSLTGTDAKSGTRQIAFSGAVNIPQLEVLTGEVRRFQVPNGDGDADYSADGGDPFALGISQADFQANQRAIDDAHSGVISVGASEASNGFTAVDFTTAANYAPGAPPSDDTSLCWNDNFSDGISGSPANNVADLRLDTFSLRVLKRVKLYATNGNGDQLVIFGRIDDPYFEDGSGQDILLTPGYIENLNWQPDAEHPGLYVVTVDLPANTEATRFYRVYNVSSDSSTVTMREIEMFETIGGGIRRSNPINSWFRNDVGYWGPGVDVGNAAANGHYNYGAGDYEVGLYSWGYSSEFEADRLGFTILEPFQGTIQIKGSNLGFDLSATVLATETVDWAKGYHEITYPRVAVGCIWFEITAASGDGILKLSELEMFDGPNAYPPFFPSSGFSQSNNLSYGNAQDAFAPPLDTSGGPRAQVNQGDTGYIQCAFGKVLLKANFNAFTHASLLEFRVSDDVNFGTYETIAIVPEDAGDNPQNIISSQTVPRDYLRIVFGEDGNTEGPRVGLVELIVSEPVEGASDGAADFTSYFPVGATPEPATATGTNATNTVLMEAGAADSIAVTTLTQGGAVEGAKWNFVTSPTSGPAHDGLKFLDTGKTFSTGGFFCRLQVLFAVGTSLVIAVEHSDNPNSGWSALHSFTAITNPTDISQLTQDYAAPAGTVVKRYVRARFVTVNGTYAAFVGYSRYSS